MPALSIDEIISNFKSITQKNLENDTSLYEVFEDSIQMFRFLGKLKDNMGVEFGMLDLVQAETIGDLARKVLEKKGTETVIEREVPLTSMQQSYRLGREQNFHNGLNSTHFYFEVRHNFNLDKAESCLRNLIEKHDALRAFVNGENQCVYDKSIARTFKITREHMSEQQAETYLQGTRNRVQTEIRSLEKWPLFNIVNIETEKGNITSIDLELMFIDGLSAQGLATEFLMLYNDEAIPNFNFEENPQYVQWIKERSNPTKHDVDKKFWDSRIDSIPEAPKLPTVEKISSKDNICRREQARFSKETLRALDIFAKKNGVTSSIVLFYLYLKTIARFSESGDFSVNITMLNRPYGIEGMDFIIGDYTSNVIYDFSESLFKGKSLKETLQAVRDKMYEYIDHSSYEGVEVIRDLIRKKRIDNENPMPIVFTSMLFGKLPAPKDIEVTYVQSQTSQVSIDNQICKTNDGGLLISWDYLEKIFPANTIKDMFKFYTENIQALADSGEMSSEDPEFIESVNKYNQTSEKFEIKHPLTYIIDSFDKFSAKTAIKDSTRSLTYGELKNAVSHAAKYLEDKGVVVGDSVGILVQKNVQTVVSILATMAAGATYIPIDYKWPKERQNFIHENSNCRMTVDPNEIELDTTSYVDCFRPNSNLGATAYVIYTSGSTGTPKGVSIAYGAMVNTILDINKRFGVSENSTILGLSSYCFDLSVYDIFGSLSTGAELDIAKDIQETAEIKNFVDNAKAILWNSVPAGMELFIDSLPEDYVNEELKSVLLSGDWISVTLPDRIHKHFPNANVYSLGGATEASIWSIYYPITKVPSEWKSIPYGYPLANQTIYILTDELEICPPEIKGEIYIGGVGVAQGYANSPEKTAAAFIDHKKYGRIYKTGDFGKFSSEGYVIFLGRKDSQVKIGGYRIELGEIEQCMQSIDGIEAAVVIVNANKQLAAFYTGENISKDKLSSELSKFLPSYMVPHLYQNLEKMPLSPNGKIDRKALSSVACKGTTEKEPVEKNTFLTGIQQRILRVWKKVLEIQKLDEKMDFFELGGDSIKAQRIAQRIEKEFNVRIPFSSILNAKSALEFAQFAESKINESVKPASADIQKASDVSKNKTFPLTGVQLAYLNGRNEHFELGKYNAHYFFEIDTEYEAVDVENAINQVVKKHDALRAIFLPQGIQKVLVDVPRYHVEVVHCNIENHEAEIMRLRNELSHHCYKHDTWPLFTLKMVEWDNHKVLFFSFDLMVCDGDSMQIFFSDIARILRKQPFESEINYSYEQYIRDLDYSKDSKRIEEDKSYWMEEIKNFPSYPHVPTVMKLSDCKEYTMERKKAVICKKTWKQFKAVAKNHRVSPSALLCTIYAKVLSRWCNQEDLLLNLTAFERKPFHRDVEKIIGDFTKLLPLSLSVKEKDLWTSASYVQERIMTGLEHLSFDGTEIMRELAKQSGQFGKALLPVVFTCVLFDSPENYYEVLGKLRYSISQTPQVFIDNQIAEMEQKLFISWDIVKEIFDPEVIDAIFNDFVENIRYIAAGEQNLLFFGINSQWGKYNPPMHESPMETTIGLVNKALKLYPEQTAVVNKGDSITYEALDKLSNQIAHLLKQKDVKHGDRVAVLGERKIETIASIVGIMKAGGVYVPVDVAYPKERIDFIMQDACCKLLLSKAFLEQEHVKTLDSTDVPATSYPEDEAYIIYTSGSTGKPKGVVMQHGAVANTIIDINERIGLNKNDALIGISSICFDLSVYDIFGSLSSGAKLALVNDARNMDEICNTVACENVTVWNSVPILYAMAMQHRIHANISTELKLRKVLLSGDWIPLDICTTSKNAGSKADLISLGGATEAAIWSIAYPFSEVKPEWNSIPYGMPLKNQMFYVLNKNLELCPVETEGDLFIGGIGLAKCYNNDPEKTSKAFIDHPKLGRIYRTGDVGKLKKEGYIEFLGRSDNQVKLHGFRIELGEIESAILHTGYVQEAVATMKDIPGSGKQIIAYVTKTSVDNAEKVLKAEISKTLTEYMIPSRIVVLEELPLSANGKVDLKSLPLPEAMAKESENLSKESFDTYTETEKQLVTIWRNVFENQNILLEDDFYSLGGESIILMKLVDTITAEMGKTVTIDDILQAVNIKELSAKLS